MDEDFSYLESLVNSPHDVYHILNLHGLDKYTSSFYSNAEVNTETVVDTGSLRRRLEKTLSRKARILREEQYDLYKSWAALHGLQLVRAERAFFDENSEDLYEIFKKIYRVPSKENDDDQAYASSNRWDGTKLFKRMLHLKHGIWKNDRDVINDFGYIEARIKDRINNLTIADTQVISKMKLATDPRLHIADVRYFMKLPISEQNEVLRVLRQVLVYPLPVGPSTPPAEKQCMSKEVYNKRLRLFYPLGSKMDYITKVCVTPPYLDYRADMLFGQAGGSEMYVMMKWEQYDESNGQLKPFVGISDFIPMFQTTWLQSRLQEMKDRREWSTKAPTVYSFSEPLEENKATKAADP